MTKKTGVGDLGLLVREAIDKSGLKRSLIAEKTGVSNGHLSHVIHGRRSLSREKILVLAGFLNCPPEDMLAAAGHAKDVGYWSSLMDMPVSEMMETMRMFQKYGLEPDHFSCLRLDETRVRLVCELIRELSR